jgi:hypothetical protein
MIKKLTIEFVKLICVVSCLNIFDVFGQTSMSKTIEVRSKVLKTVVCSDDTLKINSQIIITNKGKLPIVMQRSYFAVAESYVSDSIESLKKGHHIIATENFLNVFPIDYKQLTPSNKIFVKIGVGETFTTFSTDSINLNSQNLPNNRKGLSPGSYVLLQKVETWGINLSPGSELRKKWRKMGFLLWTDPILSEPMAFIFSNDLSKENCD